MTQANNATTINKVAYSLAASFLPDPDAFNAEIDSTQFNFDAGNRVGTLAEVFDDIALDDGLAGALDDMAFIHFSKGAFAVPIDFTRLETGSDGFEYYEEFDITAFIAGLCPLAKEDNEALAIISYNQSDYSEYIAEKGSDREKRVDLTRQWAFYRYTPSDGDPPMGFVVSLGDISGSAFAVEQEADSLKVLDTLQILTIDNLTAKREAIVCDALRRKTWLSNEKSQFYSSEGSRVEDSDTGTHNQTTYLLSLAQSANLSPHDLMVALLDSGSKPPRLRDDVNALSWQHTDTAYLITVDLKNGESIKLNYRHGLGFTSTDDNRVVGHFLPEELLAYLAVQSQVYGITQGLITQPTVEDQDRLEQGAHHANTP